MSEEETYLVKGREKKDLTFVTDEKMYEDIVSFMDATLPDYKGILSDATIFADGVMKGSNPYIAVAVDMYLKSINHPHRIATLADLEKNPNDVRDCEIMVGLALRSLEDPNMEIANHLYDQLKSRKPGIEFPIYIDLRGLTLDDRLNIRLLDEARHETAPCLNWHFGTTYTYTDSFGLPFANGDKSGTKMISTGTPHSVVRRNKFLDYFHSVYEANEKGVTGVSMYTGEFALQVHQGITSMLYASQDMLSPFELVRFNNNRRKLSGHAIDPMKKVALAKAVDEPFRDLDFETVLSL